MSESPTSPPATPAAAAQIEADVGIEHIADVYAEALLDAAERGRPDARRWSRSSTPWLPRCSTAFRSSRPCWPRPWFRPRRRRRSSTGRSAAACRAADGPFSQGRRAARAARLPAGHSPPDARPVRPPPQPHSRPADHRRAGQPGDGRQIVESLRAKLGGEPVLEQKTDPEPDRRRRAPRRRRGLRRLDRQPIAEPPPKCQRQDRP